MARKYNLNEIINEYCYTTMKSGRCVSLTEVVDFVVNLTQRLAENVRKSMLPLLMESYIRVTEEDFISDETLTFDVKTIDQLIAKKMNGAKYLPFKDFDSFDDYPSCSNNWTWNLFIFESYCLKQSKQFRRLALLYNKQCSGAVVTADYNKTFHEMIVDVVAKSQFETLDANEVVGYLKDLGYIGKAKYQRIDELLLDVQKVRDNA